MGLDRLVGLLPIDALRATGDLERCEQVLWRGLSVPDVRNRLDIIERLAHLCDEQGRGGEAQEIWRQAKQDAATAKAFAVNSR